jgi:TetR/AcrR family transcriptional regulator
MSARDAILDAADTLFGELGFDAASTRQIGEAAGINKALIHYHFASKQSLFNSVLDRYYERLNETLRGALEADGSLRERLGRLLESYVDFLNENRRFSRMVQREVASGRHVDHITEHMAPIFRLGEELVRQTYPATRDGDLAASQLLVSFYGMVVSWFTFSPVVEGLLGADPLDEQRLLERKRHLQRMLDLVLAAIDTPAGDNSYSEDR